MVKDNSITLWVPYKPLGAWGEDNRLTADRIVGAILTFAVAATCMRCTMGFLNQKVIVAASAGFAYQHFITDPSDFDKGMAELGAIPVDQRYAHRSLDPNSFITGDYSRKPSQ